MVAIRRSSFILIGVFGVLYANALPFTESPGNTIATRSTSLQGDLSTSSQDRVLPPKSRDLTLDQNDPIQERGVERRVDLAEPKQQLSETVTEQGQVQQWRFAANQELERLKRIPLQTAQANGRMVPAADMGDTLAAIKGQDEEIRNFDARLSKLANKIANLQKKIQEGNASGTDV